MLLRVIIFVSLVAVFKRHCSTQHPDFSVLKNSSIFHLSLYQFTFSSASKASVAVKLVNNTHSTGATPSGGGCSLTLMADT